MECPRLPPPPTPEQPRRRRLPQSFSSLTTTGSAATAAGRDVLGKTVLAGAPGGAQIVGVLARGFELLFPPDTNTERLPDVWFAARIPYDNVNRNQVQHRVIARLKDGVTIEQAQSAADRISAENRKNFLISGTAGYAIRIEPMQAHIAEEVRPALLALMGAVVFLWLVACANVANLMLVRASLRERELAVRTAMAEAVRPWSARPWPKP